MGSKVAALVALFLAAILLISSEVAAKELAQTSDTVEPSEEIDRLGRGFRGGYGGYPRRGYRGGYGGFPGRGGRYDGGYRDGYGGLCRFGCCGRGYNGGCRCCKYAGEMPDAEPQN